MEVFEDVVDVVGRVAFELASVDADDGEFDIVLVNFFFHDVLEDLESEPFGLFEGHGLEDGVEGESYGAVILLEQGLGALGGGADGSGGPLDVVT